MSKILNSLVGIALFGFLYFNRNPQRLIPNGDNIISPADGTIIDINNNKIEIFLAITDVHFQRSPQSGIVTNIIDTNKEYSVIELDTSLGYITVERWAGEIARTVTTFVNIGDYINKGDILGRILLGSHCSITIPPGLTIKVVKGQHILAGETIIAE